MIEPISFHLTKIPEIFYSSKTNLPFQNCLICNKYLLTENVNYFIMKSIRNYKEYNKKDVTYELALCHKCSEMLYESFSNESINRIANYWEENYDLEKRKAELLKSDRVNIEEWISKCIFTGKHYSETKKYDLYAECIGKQIIYQIHPYMISDTAMDEIAALLSNETIDSLKKFFEIYTDFPPEFKVVWLKN